MSRTGALVGSSVAALTAALLWVTVGTLSMARRVYGGRELLVLPTTSGATQLAGQDTAAWLVGIVVVALVVGALAIPVVRSGTGGWPVVVLGLWFAVALASGLANLANAWAAYGSAVGDIGIGGQLEAVGSGAYWGVAWGWVVGLVVVTVQRRPLRSIDPATGRAAVVAACTAGLVGTLGWLVVGLLRSWAYDEISPATTQARATAAQWAGALLPVPPGWFTSTLTDATPRLLPGALTVGMVEGVLVYVAARTMARRGGRTAFVLGAWFAAIAGSVAAVTIMYTGIYLGGEPSPLTSIIVRGGQFGVQYGWFDALLALAALALVDRRTRPREPVVVEAQAVV